jgi:type IV pilus assembly protein PilB
MAKSRKKLGEILVGWNVISANSLADALSYATQNGKRIGEALVELEMCSEDDVAKALATQFDMEYVDLDKTSIPHSALDLIPQKFMEDHVVLPLSEENGRLRVLITDPLDLDMLDALQFRINKRIDTALAPRSKVKGYLEKLLSKRSGESEMKDAMKSIDEEGGEGADGIALAGEDADAPIIRLINLLISEAVRGRASDIHVEPMADRVRVRYRIDGVCVERDNLRKNMQAPVTARLKLISGIDIAERRLPQDGRIKMKIGEQQIDFRVSALPSYHGESIVLRILRPDSVKVGIQQLGFEQDDYEVFQQIIKRPNGIFLVTGPTGSGKTTTLYAALQELNRPDRKIITAEDPVEYNFTGMNQCQVRDEIGLTFPRILRSMLRQAPNIILVGEIRDREVGDVAIQAALTGHLVFSTLHTNDAPSAITRLIDMGIKPFLVASAIQAIMAQRLIRMLCKECAVPDPAPDRFALRQLGFGNEDIANQKFMKAVGCPRCNNTGYRGRKGIFEMLVMNSQLRDLAFRRASAAELRTVARASGMRTLLADGKRKILKGLTTPMEILRITQAEGITAEEET